MSEEIKLPSAEAKRFDFMRLLDLLPKTLWVEDADAVLRHCLFHLDQARDEEAGQIAH